MNYKKIKTLIIIFFISFLLFSNLNVKAEDATPESMNKLKNFAVTDAHMQSYKSPTEISIDIIKIILDFLGLIFLIMILFSGFQWMTSGGNDELISKAKKRLINAIIGLAIILGAHIIATFIMHTIQPPEETGWSWF